MLLVIQVAAGIVLAYLVIRFRHSLFAVAATIAVVGVVIAALVALSAGASLLADRIHINWEKVATTAGVIPLFAFAGIGAYGLLTLFRTIFDTERPSADGDGCFPVLGLFALLNMAILVVTTVAVEAIVPNNPISRLGRAIDQWSRSSGYKDLGSTLFATGMMAVWPWAILLILAGIARMRANMTTQNLDKPVVAEDERNP